MKKLIKFIDKKFFSGFIAEVYSKIKIYYILNYKITPLPKIFNKKYGLKVRFNFFKKAQYYLQMNRMDGVYAEFGIHEVNTFRMALQTLGSPYKPYKIDKFYAFDSFVGMPEPEGIDKQKIWKKSMNFTSEEKFKKIVKRDLNRVITVKGFYENTLPRYNWPKNDTIAMAYIDCDYYKSTKECLNFIKDKLQHGSLLVFDDWNCYYADPKRGQRLAFSEFKSEVINKQIFVEFSNIDSGGQAFIVLESDKIGKTIL